MRLAVVGGGGFRVPLVHRALLGQRPGAPEVDEVVLHDPDSARLRTVAAVLEGLGEGRRGGPRVRLAADLDDALTGADAVFSAMRVGGTAGRVHDERVALGLGVLGQETVGAGGLAYALRTVPVALDLAERVARLAPDAWVVNFTNPAGIVTQAMSQVLGDRVIGICDSPSALARRAARAAGADSAAAAEAVAGYAGLNHLGWLRSLEVGGTDVLPGLLADTAALESFEEGRLFGAPWLRSLGALPNEYLWYYYAAEQAHASVRSAAATRGEVVAAQQESFYSRAAGAPPARALELWLETLQAREETYFAEGRDAGEARDPAEVEGEGYEGVALALLGALSGRGQRRLVLDVRNGSTLGFLPPDAVVEVSCTVDEHGARPLPAPPLGLHEQALVSAVKASEYAVVEAATTGSREAAVRAFAFHPLVGSVARAEALADAYLGA
ncbi:6-phospho-beta-glucosidase [Motilibacter peucedani]|uniref:6-phospho-beta-glucosidase n=1 Tax=Motilibacter peucedani TaxID=598650 RepID=A0A420XK71_9ACTN|nr:6-phospho-beta-glucosidase [Motilibacter peucedani]RKS68026.1 6-phospho-beta-glucosidase [Motilibacter peucedani]